MTYSGLVLSGPETGRHLGIQQVRVDLEAGRALEEPRSLWSGSGSMFPEAPHLYERDGLWYLLIAEGGTERGHGSSIARGPSPTGPFEPGPANPIVTARSTIRPVQNTGHGDLVEGPGGETLMVLLGVRPGGGTRAFSPLGRETFATRVAWADGWPVAEPVRLRARTDLIDDVDVTGPLDGGFSSEMMTSDHITLWAESSSAAGAERVDLARVDGRSLSAETAASFTGRVLGLFATDGTVAFSSWRHRPVER